MTAQELHEASQHIIDFVLETDREIQGIHSLLESNEDSPFLRRTTVRSLFSVIEAQISQIKKAAHLEVIIPGNFRPEEILVLEDREHYIDKGEVKSRRAKIRFIDNYILAFTLYHRSARPDYRIDFGTAAAGDFKAAIKIRDRVMHPKNFDEWVLTDDDMAQLWRGWGWHHLQMVDALKL